MIQDINDTTKEPQDAVPESGAEETTGAKEEQTAETEGTAETSEDTKAEEDSAVEPESGSDEKADGNESADSEDAAEQSEEPASDNSGDNKKDRKFFKKKKDKKDEKIEELTDKLTRQMAEFDNYRKRTEKEKAANYALGARDVIEKLLPVIDNFERGLADADLSDPFADGMDKTYKQLTTLLKDLGVTRIEAVGKEFDPNLHNAVMHVDDEELGENVVADEFQKGYLYKDQVVRHSMVKVAN